VNEEHRVLCSSAEWADAVRKWIVPWALDGVDLGESVVEIGPGPGRTTEVLVERFPALTVVEIDPEYSHALAARFDGLHVVTADAADTGLSAGMFSGAVSLTMLHHVPSTDAQDAVFAEMYRLLRPGGVFAGSDSTDSPEFRQLHRGDICVPLEPDSLEQRLQRAGFASVEVATNEYGLRFRATVQVSPPGPTD
jgi:SAM-dependent methyltransferase